MEGSANSKEKQFFYIVLLILFTIELMLAVIINVRVSNAGEYLKQISLGDKYLEELDYENAELCYRKAIAIDDKKVEPYLKIADTSVQQGDYEKANEILLQASENIPENSNKKQEAIAQQEKIINDDDSYVDNNDSNNQDDDIIDEEKNKDKQDTVSDVHKVAEAVTGYTYLGGKDYDLSYVRNSQDTDLQMGIPQTEWISEKGYISAKQYDFDKDGQEEILVVVLEYAEDTKTQIFVLHMLEQQSDNNWVDAATLEIARDTEKTYVGSLSGISAMERTDFFIKEDGEDTPIIYIESYSAASYFVDGETWGITQIQYLSGEFSIGEKGFSVAGSDINGCITLNEENSSIPDDIYTKEFIDKFNSLHMQAPSYLGFYTPLVYEDEKLIYMAGCRKMGTVSVEKAVEWQKGNEEKLQALKLTLRDYTSEAGEKEREAGAAFTSYIKNNMPDSWYVIVDMDKTTVLLTAGNTECEEKSWREWVAFSDSAEVFLYDNGAVVSVGGIEAIKGAQMYYAAQKVTAVKEAGIKEYKLEDKKLIETDSTNPYNYAGRLEFHKCRQDEIEKETAPSDIRIGTYRKGEDPDSAQFKGGYSVSVLAVEENKMHLIISYLGNNYSPMYNTEITDADINENIVTFDWVDDWGNEGNGELIFYGDTVIVNMQVTKSADSNRGSLAADALELTYVD